MKGTRPTVFFPGFLVLGLLLLSACGGGGGGSVTPPPTGTPAPSGLSYPTPQVFTVGQAAAAVTPTVRGTVTSYSVNPALPVGLMLNGTSGVISGTPTAIAAQAKYTVTASNSGGAASADVTITVNDVKPAAITYPSPTVALATGLPTTKIVPTSASGGGAVVSWSVSPALPAGLSFSTADGSITGTPTAAAAATAYTVTATNSGGPSTFTLTLSVQSGTLLDVGHADPIKVLRFDGTHVLSADVTGHWVLWNYATGATIANGDSGCVDPSLSSTSNCADLADLASQTVIIQTWAGTLAGLEFRSAVDGHVITRIATPGVYIDWFQFASDGSYVLAETSQIDAAGTGTQYTLQVWSLTGQSLLSKPIAAATLYNMVVAAPGELRRPIAAGPVNEIETTALATGVSTDSPPFQGSFVAWFADGNRFLTTISNSVLTYSSAAALQDTTPVSAQAATYVGSGNWLGVEDYSSNLSVYKVGASTSPAATYQLSTPVTVVGTNFVTLGGGSTVTVIDLSGTTPSRVDQETPVGGVSAYAATSLTQWLVGNQYGVIFDGSSAVATPRYLDYGAVLSIAGSGTRFAIATASGRVLHFDAGTTTLEGTIQDFSGKVLLSSDGTVLAALGDLKGLGGSTADVKTKVYSLPGGGVISTWPNNGTDPTAADIGLSAAGSVLGQFFGSRGLGTIAAQINPVTGGAATLTVSIVNPPCSVMRLSPDGSRIACLASSQPDYFDFANSDATSITSTSDPGAVLSGLVAGWLDDGHLLVNNFQVAGTEGAVFTGATIYSPTGTFLGLSPIQYLQGFQSLTADTIYSAQLNSILSVSSGATTWMSTDSSRGIGAVAAANVVFVSGTQVIALSH